MKTMRLVTKIGITSFGIIRKLEKIINQFFMKSILTLESELQTTFVLTLATLNRMN